MGLVPGYFANVDSQAGMAAAQWDIISMDLTMICGIFGEVSVLFYTDWPAPLRTNALAGTYEWPLQHDPDTGVITATNIEIWVNCEYFDSDDWWDGDDCPPANMFDFQSVMLHELGHVIGLQDVNEWCFDWTVMASPMSDGDCRREPRSEDRVAYFTLYDARPTAETMEFSARDGQARWDVLHEYGTRGYVLEGCETPNGPGVQIAIESPGIGDHKVDLTDVGVPLVRLVEVNTDGARLIREIASTSARSERVGNMRLVQSEERRTWTRQTLNDGRAVTSRANNAKPRNERAEALRSPSYVIFTVEDYVEDVQDLVEE